MEIAKLILSYIEVLIWPVITFVCLILYRPQFENLISRIKKAELPGGLTIETFPEEIEKAKELSIQVKQELKEKKEKKEKEKIKITHLPLTDANAKMINHGLSPSPSGLELSYYHTLAEQDTNLALAGLRIEVETMLKNLAKGFNVELKGRAGAGLIARKLRDKGAITTRQAELINKVITLCNAAIHGLKVTLSQVEAILEIAEVLRDEYVSWLSWGFDNN